MAERKNTQFDRPGGYAQPKGSTQIQRRAALKMKSDDIRLLGDTLPAYTPSPSHRLTPSPSHRLTPSPSHPLTPAFAAPDPDTRLYIGDCRDVLASLPEKGQVDLIFADPPFNWDVPYDSWKDGMPRAEYERFTFDWLDGCIECLAPHGSLWVNIPDDTAAEVVMHLKRRGLTMINWCIWHFRFGQNRNSSFIMSKVHVLYFAKDPYIASPSGNSRQKPLPKKIHDQKSWTRSLNDSEPAFNGRIWNPNEILEVSDRASIYFDLRTMAKDANKGLRVPMDVWYGKYWGRIQGNNKERRHNHHNQIPEIYLERVIKACSNPVPGFEGNGKQAIGNGKRTARDTEGNPIAHCPLPIASTGFGSLVLDPFCGSGTTSTVARALGRRSITIEYSEVNAKSAWERITKVGMVPREDAGKPQSTAIFKSRRKRQPTVSA